MGGAPSLPVRLLEFRELLPTQERGQSDSRGTRSFFLVFLRQERRNGRFHFAIEFCSVPFHLRLSAPICGYQALRLQHRLSFSQNTDSACFRSRFRAMNVIVADEPAKRRNANE